MALSKQVVEANRNLSDRIKVGGGGLLLLLGTLLIGVLAFVLLPTVLQVVVAFLATFLMVVGTLFIGTSGISGRAV